jgi:hypothetical protein
MAALSTYAENIILNLFLKGVNATAPLNWYLALYTTNPTAADTGTEVSFSGGSAYVRMPLTFGTPSGGVIATTGEVDFPVAGTNWGTISHAGIRDASTAGHLLFYGPLVTPRFISAGDVLKFLVGNISITVT